MSIPTTTQEYVHTETGYTNLTQRESKLPELGPDDVLVQNHAVSLQFRDLMVSKGTYGAKGTPTNLVPCSDMAGKIIALGPNAKETFQIGDRVCANFDPENLSGHTPPRKSHALGAGSIDGVLTKYKVFKAHSLVKIPDHLSFEEASTLPCAALTAYNALTAIKQVKAGDIVLVQGTGGVSIHGLQFAVASGATVIVTSSSDEKLKLAKKLGAKHVINYNTTPNWDEEVLKLTDGAGVDFILEVGGAGTLEKSLNAAAHGGLIVIIGLVSGIGAPSNLIFKSINKGLIIRGVFVGSVEQFESMNRLLRTHPEVTRPVVDKVFSFEQATDAFAYLESQKHVGKVVIKVA